jgi:hypothetical protein
MNAANAILPVPAPCTLCGEDVYNGRITHPCCAYWNELEPGLPCPACRESRIARWQRANRRQGGWVA